MTAKEIQNCTDVQRLRRKRDQEWEMAGCARQDGDLKDEKERLERAALMTKRIAELTGN